MGYNKGMLVFSGSSNKGLDKSLAKELKSRLGEIELSAFANNELKIRVKEKNISEKAIIVQSLSEPVNHHLIELLLISDGLKRLGVKEILGVIPYMGYSKQDKVFRQGEPLSMEVIAKILDTAGFRKIITFDLHNPDSIKFFKTPVINLSAKERLLKYFQKEVDKNTVIISPDAGAVRSAERLAKRLEVKAVYIDKQRDLKTGKVEVKGIEGEVREKNGLIVDDMLATGGTLVKTAEFLRKKGIQSIKVGVIHHLYVKGAQERINKSMIDELIVTDTVEQKEKSKKLKVISVVDLIVKEISS